MDLYELHKTVKVSTCREIRLIPSEELNPHLKINDFLKSHMQLLLHLCSPGAAGSIAHIQAVTLRKHSVMDKSQKQRLASFPVSSLSFNIVQVF